jgi:uncharacterized protein YkwD
MPAQSRRPYPTTGQNTKDQIMIVKMLLCASALLLGQAQATEQKSQPKPDQKVEKKSQQKIEKKAQPKAEAKADKKADPSPASPAEPPDKVVDGVHLAAIEANIVSYTNDERARYGLPPLEVDKELMATARDHAAWMTRNQSMVHTRLPLAENIAMGQPHSSEAVHSWMNSSGHRANILNPGHRRIGVAAYRTASGVIFWCQQFRQ